MLQAPGQLAGSGHDDLLPLQVQADRDRRLGALALGRYPGHRQAALRAGCVAGQLDEARVDEVPELAVEVIGEHGKPGADLVGRQAGSARQLDGVEQVLDQPGERVVKPGHRIARRPQHGVADQAQVPDRHVPGLLAAAVLSAVSFPSWSRTSRCHVSSA